MKPGVTFNRLSFVRVGVVMGVVACVLLASTLVPAFAAPGGADPTPRVGAAPDNAAQRVQRVDDRLEKLYGWEQRLLTRQKTRLDKANDAIARAQNRINQLKDRGVDTSRLEPALSAFEAAVSDAQTDYNNAKALLDAHAGFDAKGNVTDAAQARSTLKTAGQAMRKFHQTITKAASDLRRALRLARGSFTLKADQARLATEQKRLDQANNLMGKAQNRIDTLKGQGKDTSALETGLGNFKNALSTAQGQYDAAKKILDAHAGFDANGNVTNETDARSTLQSVRVSIQQFHQTMRQALSDVRSALRQYREANKASAGKPQ